MCMATLERRVQVLLDEERYQAAAAAARERGVSVGQVIRDALDGSLGASRRRRMQAGAEILAAEPMDLPEDPAELRRELDAAHDRFDRSG